MKNQSNKPSETKDSTNPNRNKGNKGRRFSAPRPPRIFWKSLLTNKAFDLVIVILGVSIAFYLNSLRVTSEQQNAEKFYLENIATDLDKDIVELDKILKEVQADYDVVVSYVQEYGKGAAVGDSLASVVVAILSLDTFSGNDNAYYSLVSSNGLNTLGDAALRSQVSEYYNQYNTLERFEEVYSDVVFQINDYFSPTMNYTLRKISNRSVLSADQTKNSLLLVAAQLETGIESYEETLNKARALRKSLK
jgi:Family of unknown function (DUF6090)